MYSVSSSQDWLARRHELLEVRLLMSSACSLKNEILNSGVSLLWDRLQLGFTRVSFFPVFLGGSCSGLGLSLVCSEAKQPYSEARIAPVCPRAGSILLSKSHLD